LRWAWGEGACAWSKRPASRAPTATQKIGSESGSSFSTMGSHAVRSTIAPKPASITI
jgi:hypothetical protein